MFYFGSGIRALGALGIEIESFFNNNTIIIFHIFYKIDAQWFSYLSAIRHNRIVHRPSLVAERK